MVKRPTIADLAQASGVSVATVDRVLNGRLPVREETARRVYDAATALGYHAAGLIKQRLHQELPECRFGFLLQKPDDFFYQNFARELQLATSQATRYRGHAVIDFAETQTPDEIVERMRKLAARCGAVALVGHDHPTLTAAVADLRARGTPVFSLLSDFAIGVRQGYIGIDNRKAGRTAAWMMANCARRPGKIAVFVGSHRFHGHELREIGVRTFFREHAPDFAVLDTVVNMETPKITHETMLELLARHDDLVGCYVAGGGMEGAISALREASANPLPVAICNEITPDSRSALTDGILTMVIATPLGRLCRELTDLMAGAILKSETSGPGQFFLPFDVYLPENV